MTDDSTPAAEIDNAHPARPGDWREVARLFFRLGVTGFGGPAAHIAMMRDEVVDRRGWVDDQMFLDLVGATNLVPGPNSTELAVHLGMMRAGWRGFIAAAVGFIMPAVLIVLIIAMLYDRYGSTPTALDLSYGIFPVIVAVIAQATMALGRTALKNPVLVAIALATTGLWTAGVNELLLLSGAALFATMWTNRALLRDRRLTIMPWGSCAAALGVGASDPTSNSLLSSAAAQLSRLDPDLGRLGWTMAKIGAVLYGSGYVLVSFMERDFVGGLGWLTQRQLLDAVAVGQFTPGPVFSTATFVGYQIHGVAGAAVATAAIFAPALVFVALLGRIVPLIRRSTWAAGALDGVNAASLGMLAAVAVRLGRTALVDPLTVAIAVVALIVLVRWRPNSAWLVAAGAGIGVLDGLST